MSSISSPPQWVNLIVGQPIIRIQHRWKKGLANNTMDHNDTIHQFFIISVCNSIMQLIPIQEHNQLAEGTQTWCLHDMESLPPSSGFPSQRASNGELSCSLWCSLNKLWQNIQVAGNLRRHETNVNVMIGTCYFAYDQVHSVIGFFADALAADAMALCLTKSPTGTALTMINESISSMGQDFNSLPHSSIDIW